MVSSIWAVGSSARLSKLISKIFNEVSGSCKCFELPKIEPMMGKKKMELLYISLQDLYYVVEQRHI